MLRLTFAREWNERASIEVRDEKGQLLATVMVELPGNAVDVHIEQMDLDGSNICPSKRTIHILRDATIDKSPAEMKECGIEIKWGSNSTDRDAQDWNYYGYSTPMEFQAFMEGVDAAIGWLDYVVKDEDDAEEK